MVIYLIENLVNRKVYVGQTIWTAEKRLQEHLQAAKRGEPWPICKAIRKHGDPNFEITVLWEGWLPQVKLDELEEEAIIFFDSCNPEFGYNATTGGQGVRRNGSVPDSVLKTLKKNSAEKKGKPLSQEHKKKVSDWVKQAFWINNGTSCKRLSNGSEIPIGWSLGRLPLKEKRRQSKPAWNKGLKLGPESVQVRERKSKAQKKIWKSGNRNISHDTFVQAAKLGWITRRNNSAIKN